MPPEDLGPRGQLLDVVTTDVEFHLNADFDFDFDEGLDLAYVVESSTAATVGEGDEHGHAHLHAAIGWRLGDSEVEGPFSLELTLAGMFDLTSPEMSRDDIEGWLEFNAQHLLWPYLRAAVANITTAAGLPTLTIYTIGVPRPHLGRESAPQSAEGADA